MSEVEYTGIVFEEQSPPPKLTAAEHTAKADAHEHAAERSLRLGAGASSGGIAERAAHVQLAQAQALLATSHRLAVLVKANDPLSWAAVFEANSTDRD